jgi:hypothetical protein
MSACWLEQESFLARLIRRYYTEMVGNVGLAVRSPVMSLVRVGLTMIVGLTACSSFTQSQFLPWTEIGVCLRGRLYQFHS